MLPGNVARQRTLAQEGVCNGVTLHRSQTVTLRLLPAGIDTGIVFRRVDPTGLEGLDRDVPARFDHVVDTRLCTRIANDDGVSIDTIEHLVAALAGCGVDNALIEIDGPEVPVLDGSSGPFVALITQAGVVEQAVPRRAIRVLRKISVESTNPPRSLSVMPARHQSISLEIDFEARGMGAQTLSVCITGDAFSDELAWARTFGFLEDVEYLRRNGFARGGSLDNAVVIDKGRVLNREGLRSHDELVRHKILDCVGDFYLAGAPIIGAFSGVCVGHELNNHLIRALMADRDAWMPILIDREGNALDASGDLWAETEEVVTAA